jgi:hypothetical protein
MDGISALLALIMLLFIAFFTAAKSTGPIGIIGSFILLVITSYITIYEFNANQ